LAYFHSSTAINRAVLQHLSKMNGTKENYLILGIPVTAVLPRRHMELLRKSMNWTVTERKDCVFSNFTCCLQLEVSSYFSASVINTQLPHCQTLPTHCSDHSLFTVPSK